VRQRQAALGAEAIPPGEIQDLCASFQARVVDVLLDRTFAAARWHGAKAIGIAGGVSANTRLRRELDARGAARELPVFTPSLALTTDNAAMIAAAGLRKLRAGDLAPADLNAAASLAL
jgi:N6-L-threonylcarbamoyladenine synthase